MQSPVHPDACAWWPTHRLWEHSTTTKSFYVFPTITFSRQSRIQNFLHLWRSKLFPLNAHSSKNHTGALTSIQTVLTPSYPSKLPSTQITDPSTWLIKPGSNFFGRQSTPFPIFIPRLSLILPVTYMLETYWIRSFTCDWAPLHLLET